MMKMRCVRVFFRLFFCYFFLPRGRGGGGVLGFFKTPTRAPPHPARVGQIPNHTRRKILKNRILRDEYAGFCSFLSTSTKSFIQKTKRPQNLSVWRVKLIGKWRKKIKIKNKKEFKVQSHNNIFLFFMNDLQFANIALHYGVNMDARVSNETHVTY